MSKIYKPEIVTLKPKKLIGIRFSLENEYAEELMNEISIHWKTNVPYFYQRIKEANLLDRVILDKGYDVPGVFGEMRWHYMMVEATNRRGFPLGFIPKDIHQGLAAKLIIENLEDIEPLVDDFMENWLNTNGFQLSKRDHFFQYSSIWSSDPPFEFFFPIKKSKKTS